MELTKKNLDQFVVKAALDAVIKEQLINFHGNILDVGCGKMPYKSLILENYSIQSYVGLDIENAREYDKYVKPDVIWNGKEMPFADGSFDTAMATEVLEHCFEPSVLLRESHRILKSKGLLFFTVPYLWPLHETPNDAYRYTPWSIEMHLKNAGFREIKIHPMGGWHAAMAQMMGLWVARSPLSRTSRSILTRLAIPIMKYLLTKEKGKKVTFAEGQMITGLYGTARK